MDTQAFTKAEAQGDEWSVDDVVRSIRTSDGAADHARRWVVALGVLMIAAVATATVGVSADPAEASPKPAALPARIAAAAAAAPAAPRLPVHPAGYGPASRGRSLVIVMPADHDYLSATSIPVAGLAFGRPHGPRIRSVHVALYVGERLVGGMDLEVYSGRFAGVLALDEAVAMADAEIRLSNPASPLQAAVIRSIRLDAPSTAR
jgi:hypothetical protein